MSLYNIVASTEEATVVAEYKSQYNRGEKYQSESELEKVFIERLISQGYGYLPVHNELSLITNLRTQLEKLNHLTFTDGEWERF